MKVRVIDGRCRRAQCLSDYLASVEATPRVVRTDSNEGVRSMIGELENRLQVHIFSAGIVIISTDLVII